MNKPAFSIILLLIVQGLNAQLKQKISTAIDRIEPACIEWRRQLHQYPELGYNEFKTAKLIAGHFDVRKNQVTIKSGAGGRLKLVQIDG